MKSSHQYSVSVHLLYMRDVCLQYDSLSGLALPSKKAFNNMNKEFLEKRKIGLNAYLQVPFSPPLLLFPSSISADDSM